MPKLLAEDYHADELEEDLASRGLEHLRVRRRGDTMTIESGARGRDAVAHARLRRDTVHLWRLEMPTSNGGWEATPFREGIDNLVTLLVTMFPWALAKPPTIRVRTSKPQ